MKPIAAHGEGPPVPEDDPINPKEASALLFEEVIALAAEEGKPVEAEGVRVPAAQDVKPRAAQQVKVKPPAAHGEGPHASDDDPILPA
jgi:hypothetical protein